MSSVPSQSHNRQQDSGVISDMVGLQVFPKICRDIGSEVEAATPENETLRRSYDDVIIGFISGVPNGSAFIQGGSLNANVRELHLTRPDVVAEKIRDLFLLDNIPVNIILHKAEICDPVLSVFDTLVKNHERHELVTLFVIPPVNLYPNFEKWLETRASEGPARGKVQIF